MNTTADLFADLLPPAAMPVLEAPEEIPLEPAWHPLTDEEWKRVLGKRQFRVIHKPEQEDWAGRRAVRCGNCDHAGDAGGDPWRAWCLVHRVQVSNAFPKLCREYRSA